MSWATYLQNVVVLVGFSGFAYSYYHRQKELYYQTLFEQLQKCKKYHLDYVEDISHLPHNKKVLLFGTARSLNKEPVIAASYINKMKDLPDRLWNFSFKNPFNLVTAGNQTVSVEPGDDSTVLAFNFPKQQDESLKVQKRVLLNNEPLSAYGRITDVGEGGKRLVPQIIMGSKQQNLLLYLDRQIIRLSGWRKLGVLVGTVALGSHFVYKMYNKQRQHDSVLKQIQLSQQKE